MTDTTTPEAVEPMADEREMAKLVERLAEYADDDVFSIFARDMRRLLATIDALKDRALPAPRRYSDEPLADGVYLWRKPNWHRTQFVAMGVEEGIRAPHNAPRLLADEWAWLIGPLSIPPIPESEEASS